MGPDEIKASLAAGANSAARAAQAGENIVKSAHERLEVVQDRMDAIRGTALTNPDHGQEYMALTEEAGQLARVISRGE
jgi:hypothetical protein